MIESMETREAGARRVELEDARWRVLAKERVVLCWSAGTCVLIACHWQVCASKQYEAAVSRVCEVRCVRRFETRRLG